MKWAGGIVAALLAGVSATGVGAQSLEPVPAPPPPAPAQTASDAPPAAGPADPANQPQAPAIEYRDADGKPFPPEIQRQIREKLKNSPLLAPGPAPGSGTSQGVPEGEILVTGQRPRGSVIGDIPPEQTFDPLDIRAYGASNIGELLQNLGPQVSSNRGREEGGPVTLLNGRRVSDFTEIARIPTEAIERMEVFPEELALRYGYRADQKVVNIVTFQRFQSTTGQLNYLLPTDGGRDTAAVAADHFAIRGDTRFGLGGDYSRSGSLLESERDVLQSSGAPDIGRFRTLLPATERIALNGLVSGNLLNDVSTTVNGRFEASESESLLGLGISGPLMRDINTRLGHIGTTLGGRMEKWIWSFTANYDRATTRISTNTGNPANPRDRSRSVNSFADADLVFSGPLLELPAGPLSATLRGGLDFRDFSSQSVRGGVGQRTDLSRDRGALQASLDVPIASRRAGRSSPLGNLSLNANAQVERLSDFGTLRTFGYGLNWSPLDAINVIASVTDEQGAPTVEQLGAPLVVTPNVRTFDFTRREVVDITRLFGGNPNLRSDSRRVAKIGLNVRPFANADLNLNMDFVTTRIDDPIAPFPIATPEIEAAFPERFARDPAGRLLRIDSSPLNFERSRQDLLRTGINYTRPLGPVPAGGQNAGARFFSSEADMRRAMPPGRRIIIADPGSPMARRLENMTSRLFFSLYHTWHLRDEILVREGLPKLDLRDGDATDFRGGRRRHEIEFQAGVFKRGLGARITANWQSATSVQGLGESAGDLRFSSLSTVNINLFANLADRFGGINAPKWLKGTRVSLGVNNLFDSRPRVRDDLGSTPLSYQPAYLDPLGRLVNFSLRKVF